MTVMVAWLSGKTMLSPSFRDRTNIRGLLVPTRRLLLSKPETRVSEILDRNVVVLPATATLLDACGFFILHRLLALPVVDDQRRMLGVVDVELYTDEMFIPVVLALAESVGIQSLTLTLQFQHGKGRPRWREVLPGLCREAPVGALLGLSCASLVALAAWIWQAQPVVAVCILLSVVLSIVTATLLGTLVPTLLRAVQRDPKVASGPITLALTDLATLFYYLRLATVMLA